MTILVTGAAGFIGFHTAAALLSRGERVVGLDNLTPYYDPSLKEARIEVLSQKYGPAFSLERIDLADETAVAELFAREKPKRVIHLAAQAGVRYSVDAPLTYADANLKGFLTILEGCRAARPDHLIYASTSSVYGANKRTPFAEGHGANHPVSLYAATKRANEMMAHAYSHLYDLPMTGLRFFTVYGPWGRPDMALFKFVSAILEGRPIDVYNHGQMRRDFTFVDDIVEGVLRVADQPPARDEDWFAGAGTPAPESSGVAAHRIYNIGRGAPEALGDFIEIIENTLGMKAERNMMPMQAGDVEETFCDTSALEATVGYRPKVSLAEGVPRFIDWYRSYYKV